MVFPDFYLRVSPDSLSRVGFHSWEKLESRLVVIKECWITPKQQGDRSQSAQPWLQ